MKLTLIKPNIGRKGHSMYVDEGRMEPLQLGILAALTPPDVDVKLYDDRCEEIPYDEQTDLVAITVETFTARRAYEICREYQKRGVHVIMGGMHITLIPEEALEIADSIITGDGETVWAQMIADAKSGHLKQRYDALPCPIPQEGVVTRRDLFEGKGYLPITLLQFSRGCRFGCEFCASSAYFKATQYCREVQDVIKEIKSQKRKLLFFVDDNIVSNREKAKELFRALIPLKVRWVSQGSIDMLEDDQLMRLMVKSGCLGHVIGFESINPKNISDMNKKSNASSAKNLYKEEIAKLRHYGLQTWAAFTVGHDEDTAQDLRETCKFAVDNKFTFAAFNILMPYPNTPLYEKLKSENRLLFHGKWWLDEDYRFNYAAYLPKNMTPDGLTEASFACRSEFNSKFSIFKRALDVKTNMGSPYRFITYLLYNPLFRKEVFKKQGMQFGLTNKEIDN